GLKALRGELPELAEAGRAFLADRYRLPQPRLALGQALLELASACLDVSDGLVADAAHLAEESALDIELETTAAPLPPAVRRVLEARPALLGDVLTGGDDYELLFGVGPTRDE